MRPVRCASRVAASGPGGGGGGGASASACAAPELAERVSASAVVPGSGVARSLGRAMSDPSGVRACSALHCNLQGACAVTVLAPLAGVVTGGAASSAPSRLESPVAGALR